MALTDDETPPLQEKGEGFPWAGASQTNISKAGGCGESYLDRDDRMASCIFSVRRVTSNGFWMNMTPCSSTP